MTTSEAIEVLKQKKKYLMKKQLKRATHKRAHPSPVVSDIIQALDKAIEVMGREVDRFKGCEELSNDRPHIANDDWIRFMNKQLGITSVRDLE